MSEPPSDAIVFFGATGDLAFKQIFPALLGLVCEEGVSVPIVGVAKAGWTLDITKAPYAKPYKVYGEAVTSGAVEIKWSGGNLPDDEFDEFTIQGNLQGFDAPTRLSFPATQVCGDKSVSWSDLPAADGSTKGLKHPAPGLNVTLKPADDGMAGMDMSSDPAVRP